MEQVVHKKQTTRQKVEEIMGAISWQYIVMNYYRKSSSWFYNKLHERDLNGYGRPERFTPEEIETLKGALVDIADKLRATADRL